jgi:hypothetical protein
MIQVYGFNRKTTPLTDRVSFLILLLFWLKARLGYGGKKVNKEKSITENSLRLKYLIMNYYFLLL